MTLIRDLYARFRVLIHEVAKFGIVGGLAFVLTLVLVNVFHSGLGLGPIAAATLANALATVFAFVGNKFWAFRHRKGSHWGRETLLFFVFNGLGILITDGVIAAVHYGLGLTDNFVLQRGQHHRHRPGHAVPAVLLPPVGLPLRRRRGTRRGAAGAGDLGHLTAGLTGSRGRRTGLGAP